MVEGSELSPITQRELQRELGIIRALLDTPDLDRHKRGVARLYGLIERLSRDPFAMGSCCTASVYDLLVRAKENLKIGCIDDAVRFVTSARVLAD